MKRRLVDMDPETSAFKILVFLTFKDQPMRPAEIADNLSEKGSTVRARLTDLKRSGLVKLVEGGYASSVTTYDIIMKLYRELIRE